MAFCARCEKFVLVTITQALLASEAALVVPLPVHSQGDSSALKSSLELPKAFSPPRYSGTGVFVFFSFCMSWLQHCFFRFVLHEFYSTRPFNLAAPVVYTPSTAH